MPSPRGRGAAANTPNRFDRLHLELDAEEAPDRPPTELYRDVARTILSENDSPDVGFRFSINPYRGCEHGCIYCYARPTHEYLGYSGGLDFETKILVKENAPHLLRDALRRRSWEPQVIALSGNTDPYQPVERRLQLTRRCLEVLWEYGNPVTITTKNHLVSRDADILADLATLNLVRVTLSITSLRPEVARAMEPRASAPERRLEAVEHLARKGVPVGVNVAPLVPGLTDDEIPSLLEAASDRGARWANCLVLRLPGCVEGLFLDWLDRSFPHRVNKICNALRSYHNGELSDWQYGKRFKGEGKAADLLSDYFAMLCRRCGLALDHPDLSTNHFRAPGPGQLTMSFPAQ